MYEIENTVISGCVSVIVPVFNVEKYISECIDSILKQTYSNIEIFLVDDGSTDRSGFICDNYAELDNRIAVIHKTNEGVSESRNTGLRLCRGEYVTFIDSDDFVDDQYIEKMMESLERNEADLAVFGYIQTNEVHNGGKETYEKILSSKELLQEIFAGKERYAQFAVWAHLYRRKYLKGVFFPKDIKSGEDLVFTVEVLSKVERCVCSNASFYNYRILDNSLSHSRTKNLQDVLLSRDTEIELLMQKGWLDIAYSQKIDFYNTLLFLLTKVRGRQERKLIISYMNKHKISYEELKKYTDSNLMILRMLIEYHCYHFVSYIYKVKYRKDASDIKL